MFLKIFLKSYLLESFQKFNLSKITCYTVIRDHMCLVHVKGFEVLTILFTLSSIDRAIYSVSFIVIVGFRLQFR